MGRSVGWVATSVTDNAVNRPPLKPGTGASRHDVLPSHFTNPATSVLSQEAAVRNRKRLAVVPNPSTYLFGIVLACRVLTTFSVAGLAYIVLFMAYGFNQMRYRPTYAHVARGRAIPAVTAAVSILDLVARMAVQIAYAAGAEVAAPGDALGALELFGFSRIGDRAGWARYLAPQLLVILFSLREAGRIKELLKHALSYHYLFMFDLSIPETTEPVTLAKLGGRMYDFLFLREQITELDPEQEGPRVVNDVRYSRVGTHKILAAIWVVIAGLAWPSLVSLPYTAVVVRGVVLWARRGKGEVAVKYYRALQVYTMIVGVGMYLWQIDMIQARLPVEMGLGLGLYDIAADLELVKLVPRILHAMSICGLFVSVSALASQRDLVAKAEAQAARGTLGFEGVVVKAEAQMVQDAAAMGLVEKHALAEIDGVEPMLVEEARIAEMEANAVMVDDWDDGMSFRNPPDVVPNVGRPFDPEESLRTPTDAPPLGHSPLGGASGTQAPASGQLEIQHARSTGVGPSGRSPLSPRVERTASARAGISKAVTAPGRRIFDLMEDLAPSPRTPMTPTALRTPSVGRHGALEPSLLPSTPGNREGTAGAANRSSMRGAVMSVMGLRASAASLRDPPGTGGARVKAAEQKRAFLNYATLSLVNLLTRLVVDSTVDMHVERIARGVESFFGRTYIAATALCVVTLLLPSFLTFVPLALGLLVLVVPGRRGAQLFERRSALVSNNILVWFAASYVFTALRQLFLFELTPSQLGTIDIAHAVGLYSFDADPPAMMPLLGVLSMAFFSASVSRRATRARAAAASAPGVSPVSAAVAPAGPPRARSDTGSVIEHDAGGAEAASRPWMLQEEGAGGAEEALRVRVPSFSPPPWDESLRGSPGFGSPGHRASTGERAHAETEEMEEIQKRARQMLDALGRVISMVEWFLVYMGLPIVLFAVGVAHNDVMHTIYVVFVIKLLGQGVFEVVPRVKEGGVSLVDIFSHGKGAEHRFLRLYAALHLLVMLAFKMPTLCGVSGTGVDTIYGDDLGVACYTYGSTRAAQEQQYGDAEGTRGDLLGDAFDLSDTLTGREPAREQAIKLLGLWDPHPTGDMIPVLLILLLATWHSFNDEARQRMYALGKTASTPAGSQAQTGTPGPGAGAPAGSAARPGTPRPGDGVSAGEEFDDAIGAAAPASAGEGASPRAGRARRVSYVEAVESGVVRKAVRDVQESVIQAAGHACVSYGIFVVIMATYLMVVINAGPGTLVGLGYLVLLCGVIIFPPVIRASIAAQRGEPIDDNPAHSPRGGWMRWWGVTALGGYALLDFLAQYFITFPLRLQYLGISEADAQELNQLWGFLVDTTGWSLFQKLVRPALIMWMLTLYRMGYRAGMVTKWGQIQRDRAEAHQAGGGKDRVAKQSSLVKTLRRFFIRNRHGILVLFMFFDANRNPGVLGLAFLVLTALAMIWWVLLVSAAAKRAAQREGGDEGGDPGPARFVGVVKVLGVWVIRIYAVATLLMLWLLQMPKLRARLEEADSRSLLWLNWLGLPSTTVAVETGFALGNASTDMEEVLRPKALLVAFVAIEVAAVRWLRSLPSELKAGGSAAKDHCALFWPPPSVQLDQLESTLAAEITVKKPQLGMTLRERLKRKLSPVLAIIRKHLASVHKRIPRHHALDAPGGYDQDELATMGDSQKAHATLGKEASRGGLRGARPASANVNAAPPGSTPLLYRRPGEAGPDGTAKGPGLPHGRARAGPGHRRMLTGGKLLARTGGKTFTSRDGLQLSFSGPQRDRERNRSDGRGHRRTGSGGAHPGTPAVAGHYRSHSGGGRGGGRGGGDRQGGSSGGGAGRGGSQYSLADIAARLAAEHKARAEEEHTKKKKKLLKRRKVAAEVLKERVLRSNLQLRFARVALMTVIESGWQRFGNELATLLILVAALTSFSALSFVMVGLVVAVSTATGPDRFTRTYPRVVIAVMALIVYQYVVLVGWPPSHRDYKGPDWVDPYPDPVPRPFASNKAEHDALWDSEFKMDSLGRWLQYQRVEPGTIWCLFFALACLLSQFAAGGGRAATPATAPSGAPSPSAAADVESPIQAVPRRVEKLVPGLKRDRLGMIWSEMSPSQHLFFTGIDRLRYLGVLTCLEVVLTLVVVLSTVSQDVLHLAYVLIAITLFRIRGKLRYPKQLRGWTAWVGLRSLQAVNVLVIVLVLSVQAPWEYLSWSAYKAFYGESSCKVSEIFGLHKVFSAAESLSLSRSGNLSEVLLFCLLRLLVLVRQMPLYGEVMAVARELEIERSKSAVSKAEEWKLKQAVAAESASKWRARRRQRVLELRSAVMNVAYTGNPNPAELQELVSLLEGEHLKDDKGKTHLKPTYSSLPAPTGFGTPMTPLAPSPGFGAPPPGAAPPTPGAGPPHPSNPSGLGSVYDLHLHHRSVSVLAAGSNSTKVRRLQLMENAIKRAKLNGWTGNAYYDKVPGWEEPPGPGARDEAARRDDKGPVQRQGLWRRERGEGERKGEKKGHSRRESASVRSDARKDDAGSGITGTGPAGSGTVPLGSVVGGPSRADAGDVKLKEIWSSEVGEPPSPFVRFARWLMRLAREFLAVTDVRLVLAYLFVGLVFVLDLGILSGLLCVSLLGYSLVAEKTSQAYWQGTQTFIEAMIVTGYLLQIFTTLSCSGFEASSSLSFDTRYAGLHQHPARAIPLFIAYLAVLSYNASLRTEFDASLVQEPEAGQAQAARGSFTVGQPDEDDPTRARLGAAVQMHLAHSGKESAPPGSNPSLAGGLDWGASGGAGATWATGIERERARGAVGLAITSRPAAGIATDAAKKAGKQPDSCVVLHYEAQIRALKQHEGGSREKKEEGNQRPRLRVGTGRVTAKEPPSKSTERVLRERLRAFFKGAVAWARVSLVRSSTFVRGVVRSTERRPYFARIVVALDSGSPLFPRARDAPGAWQADGAAMEQAAEAHQQMQHFLQTVLDTVRHLQICQIEKVAFDAERHAASGALEGDLELADPTPMGGQRFTEEGSGPAAPAALRSAPSPVAPLPGRQAIGSLKDQAGRPLPGIAEVPADGPGGPGDAGREPGVRESAGLRGSAGFRAHQRQRSAASSGRQEGSAPGDDDPEYPDGDAASPTPSDARRPGPTPRAGPRWLADDEVNLAGSGPLELMLYKMDQVTDPMELTELPIGAKLRQGLEGHTVAVLTVELFPRMGRGAKRSVKAKRAPLVPRSVTPSLDFVRALALAGKYTPVIQDIWRRNAVPQTLLDMLPMLEGLTVSTKAMGKNSASVNWKAFRDLVPEAHQPAGVLDETVHLDLAAAGPRADPYRGTVLDEVTDLRLAVYEGLLPGPLRLVGADSDSDDGRAPRGTPQPHGGETPRRGWAAGAGSVPASPIRRPPSGVAAGRGASPAPRVLNLDGPGAAPPGATPPGAAPPRAPGASDPSGSSPPDSRSGSAGEAGRTGGGAAALLSMRDSGAPSSAIDGHITEGMSLGNGLVWATGASREQSTPLSVTDTGGSVTLDAGATPDSTGRSGPAPMGWPGVPPSGPAPDANPAGPVGPAVPGTPPLPPPAGDSPPLMGSLGTPPNVDGDGGRGASASPGVDQPTPSAEPVVSDNMLRMARPLRKISAAGPGAEAPAPGGGVPPAPPAADFAGAQILHVEAHSREKQDFYPASVAFDFLSFIYAAVFFRAVFPTDADFANTGTSIVPLSYLLMLLSLFLLMVIDRMCYILGSASIKALLQYFQVSFLVGGVIHVYWLNDLKVASGVHLRIYLVLKAGALVFGALQLRSGYPEGSSYREGIGRFSQFYHQFPNVVGWWVYAITTSIPFVFELRHLLDWACTQTTLRLVDWLVIEDIHASLFLATFDRNIRHFRYLGRKEPSWRKVVQGVLLFFALCALVWMPLVLFASNNPAFQTPTVELNSLQVTIGAVVDQNLDSDAAASVLAASDAITASAVTGLAPAASLSVPIFTGGYRWLSTDWMTEDTRPAQFSNMGPEAVQLLCVDPESTTRWRLTPPMRDRLNSILDDEDAVVTVTFAWGLRRNQNAAHECQAQTLTTLSRESVAQIKALINGDATRAELSSVLGVEMGLYSLFWRVGGDPCEVDTSYQGVDLYYSRKEKSKLGTTESGVTDSSSGQTGGFSLGENKVFCDAELKSDSTSSDSWWALSCAYGETREGAFSKAGIYTYCPAGGEGAGDDISGPQVVALLDKIGAGDVGAQLSSLSISGLYLGVVWAVGKFVRVAVTNMKLKIPYEQIPDPKRLRALIDDIYIARSEGDLETEEELFWTLITIYRVPSVLFELTRKKLKTH